MAEKQKARKQRIARLPKGILTIRDVLSIGDVAHLLDDLVEHKDQIGCMVAIVQRRDRAVFVHYSRNLNAVGVVYLLENAKLRILDEQLAAEDEGGTEEDGQTEGPPD